MPVVNLTGSLGNNTIDCTVDEPHFSGSATQQAGTSLIFNPGAGTPNPIRFDGSYNWTSTTTGGIQINGTSAKPLRVQPNGAATTWPPVAGAVMYLFVNGSAAEMTLTYADFFYVGVANWSTISTTNTNIRLYVSRQDSGNAYFLRVSAGATTTATDIEVYGAYATGMTIDGTGGTVTAARWYAHGCVAGISWTTTGGTYTVSDIKIVRCQVGLSWSPSNAITITNLRIDGCATPISGTPTADITITRAMIAQDRHWSNLPLWGPTPGAGRTFTMDEWYMLACDGNVLANVSGAGTHARMPLTNSVVVSPSPQLRNSNSAGLFYTASSGCDIGIGSMEIAVVSFAVHGGTTDNDAIFGYEMAWVGAVPAGNEGPCSDYADANFVINFDADSGNTTSTETQAMYGGPLAANRTNARATLNKPLTVSSILATPGANTVNITWTTGIKARSRILFGTAAGVTRANATSVSPWKYHGILDPEMVDFTLPVTSHDHTVSLPPGTYFYVPENYDPCGRRFLGAEGSVTIAASGGGGSIFGGGVIR